MVGILLVFSAGILFGILVTALVTALIVQWLANIVTREDSPS